MPELSCPNCGGMGRVPRDKINSRLVCKKCHMVFHLAPNGRAVLGEPPPAVPERGDRHSGREAAAATKPQTDWRENLPEFTVTRRSAVISLGVLAVVAIGYFLMSRTPESLGDRAKVVAQAFADGDLSGLKGMSAADSVDDMVQWYGVAHPLLEEQKKQWVGKDVLVGVLVVEENPRQRVGQVTAFLAPSKGPVHAEAIAKNADAEAARKPVEVTLYFSPDAWGKWRLDGKKTNQAAPRLTMQH